MFPANFDYHRAASVDDAVRLLAQHPDAKLLAGGHSLLPMMKLRLAAPGALIDIGRIADLRGVSESGGRIRIGALTTHAEVASSELLAQRCPLLTETAHKIADPAVRNRGTVGGNIAHADPASDLPAVLVALAATVHLQGPNGARQVAASDFFTGLLESDIGADEVLTAVDFAWVIGGGAYLKVENPASGYAVCGAAAVVRDGVAAALCFNGITATPLVASAVCDALAGSDLSDGAIAAAVDAHLQVEDPLSDVHASGEYRVQLAKIYGQRALRTARDRARG